MFTSTSQDGLHRGLTIQKSSIDIIHGNHATGVTNDECRRS